MSITNKVTKLSVLTVIGLTTSIGNIYAIDHPEKSMAAPSGSKRAELAVDTATHPKLSPQQIIDAGLKAEDAAALVRIAQKEARANAKTAENQLGKLNEIMNSIDLANRDQRINLLLEIDTAINVARAARNQAEIEAQKARNQAEIATDKAMELARDEKFKGTEPSPLVTEIKKIAQESEAQAAEAAEAAEAAKTAAKKVADEANQMFDKYL